MPVLTYPLALLGLLALPLLVGVYFLRNRYKKHDVSSLFLWESFTTQREGGLRVTRLQTPWSLFLELLILILLLIAAADPRWKTGEAKRPLVVVLDNSASMSLSRADAIDALRDTWDDGTFADVRFLLAETEPRTIGPAVASWSLAESALVDWTCTTPEANLEPALAAAAELGGPDARLLVLTDRSPASTTAAATDGIVWRAFGRPGSDNLAIVNATRSRLGGTDRCFVELQNFGRSTATPTLSISGRSPETPTLAPGERHRVIFNRAPADPPIEIEVNSPGDALSVDNRAVLLPRAPRPVKIDLQIANPGLRQLVERALTATGTNTIARGSIRPHWLITDRIRPVPENPDTWMLELIAEKDATALTGPFIIDPTHPIGRGLDLDGVIWGAATTNDVDLARARPLLAAGNTALLSADARHLKLHWNPAWSNLHQNPNWPILWFNLLDWRRASLPGVADPNVRVGADVSVGVPRDAKEATLKSPRGTDTLRPSARQIRFTPNAPGTWEVEASQQKTKVVANFLAPAESNLKSLARGTWGRWSEAQETRRVAASSAWLWLSLALIALLAHLWVAFRRGGFA